MENPATIGGSPEGSEERERCEKREKGVGEERCGGRNRLKDEEMGKHPECGQLMPIAMRTAPVPAMFKLALCTRAQESGKVCRR